jgi:hypothetical protein
MALLFIGTLIETSDVEPPDDELDEARKQNP